MKQITLEELLSAGCHFGHQVTRSNPKARDFVFEARDNIQIIDLAKTKEGLEKAADFVRNLGENGGKLLVVATKKQAKQLVEEEVLRVREVLKTSPTNSGQKLFYITQRWVGGILTNFPEVSKNFKKLDDLKVKLTNKEEQVNYTKKEIGLWDKERQRLENFYSGISDMGDKPDALFIVDSHLEYIAVAEANNTGVSTVAIVDTNADPYLIDYPIPANDDAVGSIKLIASYVLDAFAEGVKQMKDQKSNLKSETPEPKSDKIEAKVEKEPEVKKAKTSKVKSKKQVKSKKK